MAVTRKNWSVTLNIIMKDIVKPYGKKKKFWGIKLEEIPDLERLFEVNVFVYSLELLKTDKDDGEDNDHKEEYQPEIAAQLARFNLYGQHFSYIKDHNVRQICRVLMGSYYTIENGGSCYLIERFITSALNIRLITMYT